MIDGFDWLDNPNIEVYNPIDVFDDQSGILESARVGACTPGDGPQGCVYVDGDLKSRKVTGGGVKVRFPF